MIGALMDARGRDGGGQECGRGQTEWKWRARGNRKGQLIIDIAWRAYA